MDLPWKVNSCHLQQAVLSHPPSSLVSHPSIPRLLGIQKKLCPSPLHPSRGAGVQITAHLPERCQSCFTAVSVSCSQWRAEKKKAERPAVPQNYPPVLAVLFVLSVTPPIFQHPSHLARWVITVHMSIAHQLQGQHHILGCTGAVQDSWGQSSAGQLIYSSFPKGTGMGSEMDQMGI